MFIWAGQAGHVEMLARYMRLSPKSSKKAVKGRRLGL